MNELGQLIGELATLSWRYNTFRGRWAEMPDSTGLCIVLGILSFTSSVLVIWVEYGGAVAMAIPVVWLSAIWLFATDGFSVRVNKRLASAVFLLSIPAMLILAMVGSGQQLIEVLVGMYLSATILTLRTRE
ncbi:hypothetical protein [Devosia sp.]|uniref:hypothetical protein n=1 Tax=Devosia sp. TaxID=1871048 RepID=UPI0027340877|nr:hypothetical protein [Devosia sp.]MDP2779607.1 hypothetical protein [Devosia sp.]